MFEICERLKCYVGFIFSFGGFYPFVIIEPCYE